MLKIENFNIRGVLIDNGSLADIMYSYAFQQMKIEQERPRPFHSPLVSFSRDKVYPKGIITLTMIIGTFPNQMKKDIDFLVVDCPSSYNMIIRRLALNKFKASTSTYYLKMKFPMENGVGEVWGDQAFAQECYQAVLAAEENHTWIVKEAKPEKNHEEELEEI